MRRNPIQQKKNIQIRPAVPPDMRPIEDRLTVVEELVVYFHVPA